MNGLDPAALAGLADVAVPASGNSAGALFLQRVCEGVEPDLAESGPGPHAVCLRLAAEDAEPDTDEERFAAFVDLGLWAERLPTRGALHAVGRRLGAALVAAAT